MDEIEVIFVVVLRGLNAPLVLLPTPVLYSYTPWASSTIPNFERLLLDQRQPLIPVVDFRSRPPLLDESFDAPAPV